MKAARILQPHSMNWKHLIPFGKHSNGHKSNDVFHFASREPSAIVTSLRILSISFVNLFMGNIRVMSSLQVYAIGILLIDFHFSNLDSSEEQTEDLSCNSTASLLNITQTESNTGQPMSLVNRLFIGQWQSSQITSRSLFV